MTVKISEELTRLCIEDLDLSVRSENALKSRQIKTFGQLVRLSDGELLKAHGFGRKCLEEVRSTIAKVLASHAVIEGCLNETEATESKEENSDHGLSQGGWAISTYREEMLDSSVDLLDLTVRPTNVLSHLGILTLRELLDYSKRDFARFENIGRKSVAEVEAKLRGYLSGESNNGLRLSAGAVTTEAITPRIEIKEFANHVLSILPERQRGVLTDRYGLWDGIAETLQDIGDKFGLTRERIRQIEASGLKRIRRKYKHGAIRRYIVQKIRSQIDANKADGCGIIGEDETLSALAIDCTAEEVELAIAFLQDIDSPGESVFANSLTEIEPGVYCVEQSTADGYRAVLHLMELSLKSREKPLTESFLMKEIEARADGALTPNRLQLAKRVLSFSSQVYRLRNGTVVLSQWTEFSGHDATRLAEAALRLLGRSAHFREITEKANTIAGEARALTAGTIHNTMIKKPEKFVWLKSGTYGLAAWGLKKPPFVKDRLVELLSGAGYPLPLWHLEEKVLEVCNCKLESIRMTLDLNPKLFTRFEGDQYGLRRHFAT